ncbi:GHMP family kinase ATP-binding protein [Nocardiopsis lambiniae]|uniref:GHMP kinase n=1 Tax=Nocardiopsis lambiniae TaxID=3075539 RepID=A0ABU2M6Y4_9ACTN|nr:GHMP kinase [Nocardiopsis sp. DSM 44743]MDT0328348.1 GHMP kinase [Nocardiopsis sp. DSM 44743]
MITGTGRAACHHGEIVQGVFLDRRGRPRRGLVTLPMAAPVTEAVFTPLPGTPAHRVDVHPVGRAKAARAAALAVAECATRRAAVCGGTLRLRGGVPTGLGLGSSTSDVTAAIRAVCAGFGVDPSPATVARIAVAAEGASDPIMWEGGRALLFAQREGRVLEDLGAPLPPMVVVGCLTGGGAPVNTLALRIRVDRREAAVHERLRAALRVALAVGDAAEVGRIGTESAILNQRVLPKPELGTIKDVARLCGAVGVQVAHSGNVAGVLFDARVDDLGARIDSALERLRGEGLTPTRVFSTPHPTHGETTWTTTCARPLADRT